MHKLLVLPLAGVAVITWAGCCVALWYMARGLDDLDVGDA